MSKKLKIDLVSLVVSFMFMVGAYLTNIHSTNTTAVIVLWILAFLIGGRAKAMEGIEHMIEDKSLNVEFLMVLSAFGAFLIGHYQEGAILIIIFSLSGVLEGYTLNKAEKTLTSLMELVPETAIKVEGSQEIITPITELCKGDIVVVKVGQQVPADGIIIRGSTYLNEAAITGESALVVKNEGDRVVSGTFNETSAIHVELSLPAKDSAMQKIVDFIKVAQTENTSTELGIKKFEKYYVYFVVLFSILLMTVPYFMGIWSLSESVNRGIILLVVASPCALVASVSPVMLSAMSNATKKGVLIKGSKAIHEIANIKTIFLDKTGTITHGEPRVVKIDFLGKERPQLPQCIYHIEKQSNHPLGRSIVEYIENNYEVNDREILTTEIKGYGVEAVIDDNHFFIGKRLFNNEDVRAAQKNGYTTVEVIKNNELVAIITLEDKIRDNAASSIALLKEQGIKTVMITGDNEHSANKVASSVNVDRVISECLPEQKVVAIKKEKETTKVAMIGDGINDGPALAIADVGISMGSGTDVAIETSDVILMNNSLDKVPDIVELSKKAKKVYTQNIIFSITVISLLILMNVLQIMTLPLGVVFHEGSTILVILNGLRLLSNR